MREIIFKDYYDKVYGGWLGKMIGGGIGAPYEGYKINKPPEIEIKIPDNIPPNDDNDLQLLWLKVLEEKGLHIDSTDLAEAWKKHCWYPFAEYGYFLKNYEAGIEPPFSGWFNNEYFDEGMGCPIRSEIWAMIWPGNPEQAARYACMDGVLDHSGESVWAEEFLAVMEAEAFFIRDISELLNLGLKYVPEESKLFKCITDIRNWNKEGLDWKIIRDKILRSYGHPDMTNSIQNMGFIVLALLAGEMDFIKTLSIAVNCGYDADCTCATVGALLGIIMGTQGIPGEWKNAINDSYIIGIDVERRSDKISDLAYDTCIVGCVASEIVDGTVKFTDIPSINLIPHKRSSKDLEIAVIYNDLPSIGIGESTDIEFKIKNNSQRTISASIKLDIPKSWIKEFPSNKIELKEDEVISLKCRISVPGSITAIDDVNFLCLIVETDAGTIETKEFGMMGASQWKCIGPFWDTLEAEEWTGPLSPHSIDTLPPVETMASNETHFDREYINEKNIENYISNTNDLDRSFIINSHTDKIPVEHYIKAQGPMCVYLSRKIVMSDEQFLWMVIGNNDAFKVWINGKLVLARDEIRWWTPLNNSKLVYLKESVNTITVKLLRRSDELKFSFGFKYYEGKHWHVKRWYAGYKSLNMKYSQEYINYFNEELRGGKMAKEIMERKADDNKYLHKDFHNLMNLGIEYLREHFGEESVREYLRQFTLSLYAPLKKSLKEKGLTVLMEHNKEIYTIEEALDKVEFSLSKDELIIRVKKCPAIEHMKKSGISISPLYYETTKTVNETICEDTPFAFELLEYDDETGASVQRFFRKGE